MFGVLTNRVRVRRRSAILVGPAAAAQTMSVLGQPPRESLFEVGLSGGTSSSGEVSLQGLVAGVTTTETLVFSGDGYKQTVRSFTSLAAVTTSGLADELVPPTVQVRAIGRDGSAQEGISVLREGWPAGVAKHRSSWRSNVADGSAETGQADMVLAYDETWAPRIGDLIDDDDGETWEVVGLPRKASVHFGPIWHCALKRHEGSG